MKNLRLMIFISIFLVSCVKSGGNGPAGGPTGGTNPTPTIPRVNAETLISQIVSQPSLAGAVGVSLENGIVFEFKKSNGEIQNPPISYSIKAYKDKDCVNLASGSLSGTPQTINQQLVLSNVRYSRAEDIHIGISGTNITKSCSRLINVASAAPAYFGIVGGFGQSALVNTTLADPIQVVIMDAYDKPVQNARVKIGDQISGPSNSSGVASLYYKLGTVAGEYVLDVVLNHNEVDLHIEPILVTALSGQAKTIAIAHQDEPTTVISGELSDPIYLQAFDSYTNAVHPDYWFYTWDVFSDSKCSVPGQPLIGNYLMVNPVLDESDSATWLNLYLYAFEEVGDVYIKFMLLNDSQQVIHSVCSRKITVLPAQQP